jgi:EKC/KEOPS complex subunit CGI121/TPRKB
MWYGCLLIDRDSMQILEAFRKFGIQDSTTNLLVIKVPIPTPDTTAISPDPPVIPISPSAESIEIHLRSSIQGIPLSLDDDTLMGISDLAKVRTAYKISAPVSASKTKTTDSPKSGPNDVKESNTVNERLVLERAILGLMALRGAT